jgi:hypothetical protein
MEAPRDVTVEGEAGVTLGAEDGGDTLFLIRIKPMIL